MWAHVFFSVKLWWSKTISWKHTDSSIYRSIQCFSNRYWTIFILLELVQLLLLKSVDLNTNLFLFAAINVYNTL